MFLRKEIKVEHYGETNDYLTQHEFPSILRPGTHQGNWQLQRNHNFKEESPISSRQLKSRLARAH
jgi:hypothetical protein